MQTKQPKFNEVNATGKTATANEFHNNLSPLDTRYRELNPTLFDLISVHLSEAASYRSFGKVEAALAATLSEFRIAPPNFGRLVEEIVQEMRLSEVYEEERRIQHNIRALVNYIHRRIPSEYKPYVHLFATSSDIIDSARSVQYKEFIYSVTIPLLIELLDTLYEIIEKHAFTPQIGRTHGRHAEPTTLGYWLSWHAQRIETRLGNIHTCTSNLIGKLSGAVGTRASVNLAIEDARGFEAKVLEKLGLAPAKWNISTQIAQPEPILDLMHSVISCFGVMANIADDFRHLMRSEINEIQEADDPDRVGSSTMPHKINPKDFENVKSFWKTYMPRMITNYMDQISEHQRDLTNSASQRFSNEILAGFTFAVDRLIVAIQCTTIDTDTLKTNLIKSSKDIVAEPLYIGLAMKGVADAHEIARKLSLLARKTGEPLLEAARNDPLLANIIGRLPKSIVEIIKNPATYFGDAGYTAQAAAQEWRDRRKSWEAKVDIESLK